MSKHHVIITNNNNLEIQAIDQSATTGFVLLRAPDGYLFENMMQVTSIRGSMQYAVSVATCANLIPYNEAPDEVLYHLGLWEHLSAKREDDLKAKEWNNIVDCLNSVGKKLEGISWKDRSNIIVIRNSLADVLDSIQRNFLKNPPYMWLNTNGLNRDEVHRIIDAVGKEVKSRDKAVQCNI